VLVGVYVGARHLANTIVRFVNDVAAAAIKAAQLDTSYYPGRVVHECL